MTFKVNRQQKVVEVLSAKFDTLPDFMKGAVTAAQKDPKCDPFFRGAPFYAMLFGNPAVDYVRCVDRSSAAKIVYR